MLVAGHLVPARLHLFLPLLDPLLAKLHDEDLSLETIPGGRNVPAGQQGGRHAGDIYGHFRGGRV